MFVHQNFFVERENFFVERVIRAKDDVKRTILHGQEIAISCLRGFLVVSLQLDLPTSFERVALEALESDLLMQILRNHLQTFLEVFAGDPIALGSRVDNGNCDHPLLSRQRVHRYVNLVDLVSLPHALVFHEAREAHSSHHRLIEQ